MKRAPWAAAVLLLAACDRATHPPSRARRRAEPGDAATTSASAATTSASAATITSVTTAAITIPGEEQVLLTAPLVALTPARGPLAQRGTFDATLAAPEGARTVTLELALLADPVAYRPSLAFARLARGLGARVAPIAVLRRVGAGELAEAAASPDAISLVREARVQNDGTVDALLSTRGSASAGSVWEVPGSAIAIDAEHGREVLAWERWSWSAAPAVGEDGALLRDYVEMLALDYLSANVARRRALLAGRALVLTDNASAFPAHPDGPALDHLLRRLRAAQRFPRGLRAGLLAFDRDRSAAAFAEGGFETWLLSPRTRVLLDERRAALLTLIEAKIGERGADAVLSL